MSIDGPPRILEFPVGGRKPAFRTGSEVELAQTLVAELRQQHGQLVHSEGRFYAWRNSHFDEITDPELHVRVQAYDGAGTGSVEHPRPLKLSSRQIKGVIEESRAIATSPRFFDDAASGINCASGLIRLESNGDWSVERHHPDHRLRNILKASFNGHVSARPPSGSLLCTLLDGCFRDDPEAAAKIAIVGELAGAAAAGLVWSLKNPKAVILMGETAENGKSQILELLKGLLPSDAATSITPAQMANDQFRAQLAGKLLNISDELGAAAISSDVFKAVVTGDPVMGKIVYMAPFSFRPRALHVFATNRLPSFAEGMDRGVRRRLSVLTFERTIPMAERIVDIGRRIAEREIDVLLSFAVAGAQRLLQQGAFTETESGRQALARWIMITDPVQAFVQDDDVVQITGEYSDQIRSGAAYQNFRKWCEAEGIPSSRLPTHPQFTGRVNEMALPGLSVRRRGTTGSIIHGIKLRRVAIIDR